jgi:CHAT domain-containing protein/tetratricopeptide (TPR) repeat protein
VSYSQNNIDSIDYYRSKKLIDKAINYALREKSKLETENCNNTICYADHLIKIGDLYSHFPKFSPAKGEAFYVESLSVKKRIFGETSIEIAVALEKTAQVYTFAPNEFKKRAEPLLYEAYLIRRTHLPENKEGYIKLLSNMSYFYQVNNKGIDEYLHKTLDFRLQLMEMCESSESSNSICLSNLFSLAWVYDKKKDFKKAEEYYLEHIEKKRQIVSLDISNKINKDFYFFEYDLINIADFYLKNKKFDKSECFYEEAVSYRKKISSKDSKYAYSLIKLGLFYNQIGEYIKAIKNIQYALDIYKNHYKENDYVYLRTLNFLASSYLSSGNVNKAEREFESVLENFNSMIINSLNRVFVEEDFSLDGKKSQLLYPLSFINNHPNTNKPLVSLCYHNVLLLENLSLKSQEKIIELGLGNKNSTLFKKIVQFNKNRKAIDNIKTLPEIGRPNNYWELDENTRNLEYEIVKLASKIFDYKNTFSINWKKIQEKLKKDEAVVDLVAFNYFNKKWTDSTVYAAFLVNKTCKNPKYISLFEQKQLDFLLSKDMKSQEESIRIDKQYTDKAISDLFLTPLEKELEGIKTVYLSPAGLGHQIDFSALPITVSQTFGEKYNLHILSAMSELIDYKTAALDKKSDVELLLYGGIDFNKSLQSTSKQQDTFENNKDIEELRTRSGITGFNYLSGTNDEVKKIEQFAKEAGYHSTVLNGANATEESIKQLDGRTSPFVLHLATHGFFFPDPVHETPKEISIIEGKSKMYKASDDPMMRSGLLLSGANNYWGKLNQNNTVEDGILTANEISNLDLSACQLVVLSACETGLGEVKGSEGVFGLQRAFKMSGVKNIIMSLWKVPDSQTAELFEIFYGECFAGKTIHEAFQAAQSKMKTKYSPYYWAGFVLLE